MEACYRGYDDCVEALLRYGVNPSFQQQRKRTALSFAIAKNRVLCVELLIQANVDLKCVSMTEQTPLQEFCSSNRKSIEIASLLIKAAPDLVNLKTTQWSPLLSATYFSRIELVQYLLDSGAEIDCVDAMGRTALHLYLLYQSNPLSGEVVLMALLQAGANPNHQDCQGKTPLILLLESHHGIHQIDPFLSYIKLLLEYGADVEILDNSGKTALSYANDEALKIIDNFEPIRCILK